MTDPTEPKSRHELMEVLQAERELFDRQVAALTESQMLEPGIEGDRSVKDILAHVTDWEQRMILWLNESLADRVPQRPAPGMTWDDLDRLNEQTYLANRDTPLEEVLAMSVTSYEQALQAVHSLTDEDLFDKARFAWRKGDPMWHMVAANTWWHYKEHRGQLEAWLREQA